MSFDRAYAVAVPGETVWVAGGSYPGQAIASHGARSTPAVVFRPRPGDVVRMTGQLDIYASRLEIQDFRIDSNWYIRPGAFDITMRDVDVDKLFITSASQVRVLGGDVGPADSSDSQIKASNTSGAAVPEDILIDDVTFHDFTRNADPTAHVECLQFGAGRRVTVQNSRFINCETQGLFFRSWGGTAKISDLLIENNYFDATTVGYYSLVVADMAGQTYENVVVRNNTALQPLRVDAGSAVGVRFVGNLGVMSPQRCLSGQVFSHNVWQGAACSTSDRNVSGLGLTDAASHDYRLMATSPAIDAGDPLDHPLEDFEGQLRAVPDAGADERDGSAPLASAPTLEPASAPTPEPAPSEAPAPSTGATSGGVSETTPVLSVPELEIGFLLPTSNSTFRDSATLWADATGPQPINYVVFWDGSRRLSTDRTAPYRYVWRPGSKVAYGLHTLRAVAYDVAGSRAETSVAVRRGR